MRNYKMYVNGEFINGHGGATEILNPSTEEVISTVQTGSETDAQMAVAAAAEAQSDWARRPAIERAKYLKQIAAKIREKSEYLAHVISEEQGKVLPLARFEVELAANHVEFAAEWARRYEGEILQSDRENENILIFKKPVGVVAGIIPWNFPFASVARKMGPALVTGNTIIIKPAEVTSNNALEFAQIVAEIGLPPGVFNVVPGKGRVVGAALASDPRVGLVTFTGSVETGADIMRRASDNITKVSLELGGKAPAIVMNDADIDLAVREIVKSRIANSGQLCICPERVYVQSKIADEFITKYIQAMSRVTYGNPLTEQVDMGPLVSQSHQRSVESAVNTAVREGAQLVLGGTIGNREKGYYFEPTVLVNCNHDMEIMKKEVFGPVTPIQEFQYLDEAIELSNDSEYGLSSSIYTNDLNTVMYACNELKFGETYVNRDNGEAFHAFHSGWRKSGIGGDDGKHGLNEYLQSHVVYIQR